MNSSIISVCLFLMTVSSGYGLKCYQCDSSQSSLCNIGLFSFLMPTVDCSQENGDALSALTSWIPKQCVKLTAKDAEGKEFVARGCIVYSGVACEAAMKTLGFFSELSGGAKDLNCYPCNGDKCNSSFNVKPSFAATIILSLVFLLFRL